MKSDSRGFDYEPVTRPIGTRRSEVTGSSFEPGIPRDLFPTENVPNEVPPSGKESEPDSSTLQSSRSVRETNVVDKIWTSRRGHGITFALLFLYTTLAYFRPYELSPALAWTAWLPYSLAVVAVAIFIPCQLGLEGRLTSRPREVNLFLLFSLLVIVSLPQAIDTQLAWNTFYSHFFKTAIIFIITVNVLRTEFRLKAMILLALIVGGFMSVAALQDYAFRGMVDQGIRAKVSINNMFGEPNALALHLVTVIPLAVGLLLSSKNTIKKLIYAAGVFLMVGGIFVTSSRGGFLGLLFAAAFLALKLGRRNRAAISVLIGIGALVLLMLAPQGLQSRLSSITGPHQDSSAAARRDVLIRSILVSLHSPLLGVGIGNFSLVSIGGQVSHNSFTQVASEVGLPALILFVMFLGVSYRRLTRIQNETYPNRRHSQFYYLAVGLQASFAGCLVGIFFLSVAYEGPIYSLISYSISLWGLYYQQNIPGGASLRAARNEPSSASTGEFCSPEAR